MRLVATLNVLAGLRRFHRAKQLGGSGQAQSPRPETFLQTRTPARSADIQPGVSGPHDGSAAAPPRPIPIPFLSEGSVQSLSLSLSVSVCSQSGLILVSFWSHSGRSLLSVAMSFTGAEVPVSKAMQTHLAGL